ncbi:hypothetical protein JA1_005061 [Spathaspora sp. JA1]|nr:hypothetical protein JA1_005061 [Spathaspora sp. JA1]
MPPKQRTKSVSKPNQKTPEPNRRVSSRISERAATDTEDTPKKKPNSGELIELVNDLANTKQDEVFTKYQTKIQTQLENDHLLIQNLQLDLRKKNETIDKLVEEISRLKQSQTNEPEQIKFESPIRTKHTPMNSLSKELENITISLDMIELLAGVRVVNFQEDEEMLYFDVKQSSPPLYITYQLIISKEFEVKAKVHYIPTFLDVLANEFDHGDDEVEIIENARVLQRILPDYFLDKIEFSIDTLNQFYSKLARALNKKK